MTSEPRVFLFLQGPHGPFFAQLSKALKAAGHATLRLGFNGGDERNWDTSHTYIAFQRPPHALAVVLGDILASYGVTDLVLYADTRPVHRRAIEIARGAGMRVHCFEEGYLRPYWITYERDGVNGNSKLMTLSMSDIAAQVKAPEAEPPEAPAHWGETRHHSWHGARYHAQVWLNKQAYPYFQPHRREPIGREFILNLRRLVMLPAHALVRDAQTRRLHNGARPYHVVLNQLEHDANMRDHSQFSNSGAFVQLVSEAFADGAPAHHQLVFKAHPFDDRREDLAALVDAAATRLGIRDRVWFLRGGRLGPLLDRARSAVTINSTAAQQAMWRGLPVRAFGRAIYAKAPLVSEQPLSAFFANPDKPDLALYRLFRLFLLETSQIPGGYYSARGRRNILRVLVDRMLSDESPYSTEEPVQNDTVFTKLRLVACDSLT